MTVSTTHVRSGPYAGNGITLDFPVDFQFRSAEDVAVIELSAVGVETLKTRDIDYTVTGGAGSTGTVSATTPPPAGVSWTIVRRSARTQPTAFVDADSLPAKRLEDGFDVGVLIAQEADDKGQRSLRLPDSDGPLNTVLPPAVQRAGKVLAFDPAGNAITSIYLDPTPANIGAQPHAANLDALASVTSGADLLPFFTGPETVATTPFTAFARQLLEGASALDMRGLLDALANDGDASSTTMLPIGAVVKRTMAQFSGRVVYAEFWDVKADGVTDDTAALQAAINSITGTTILDSIGSPAGAGCTVVLPRGNIRTTAPIVVTKSGISIVGAGRDATVIRPDHVAGHVFQIGNNASITRHIRLAGFSIKPSVAKTSGSSISIDGAQRCVLEGIDIFGGWDGINVENHGNQAVCYIRAVNIIAPLNEGVQLGKNSSSYFANGVHLSNMTIAQTGGSAVTLYHASGVYASNVETYLAGAHGISIAPGVGQAVEGVEFRGCLGDSPVVDGVYIGGAGKVAEIRWIGGAASSCGGDGVRLDAGSTATINGVTIDGIESNNNQAHGVNLGRGKNIAVTNCAIWNNSRAGNAIYHGIVVAAGLTHFTIQHNMIGDGGWMSLSSVANYQAYGIMVLAGASDWYEIVGNLIQGNISGSILDGGTGANKLVVGPGMISSFGGGLRAGGGPVRLGGALSGNPSLEVRGDTDAGINRWIRITGAGGGNNALLQAMSSASAADLVMAGYGGGSVYLCTASAGEPQLQVAHTAGSTHWPIITGSAGGDSAIGTNSGRLNFTAIPAFPPYTFATLPLPTARSVVIITDRSHRIASADGTNWRFQDGNVVT